MSLIDGNGMSSQLATVSHIQTNHLDSKTFLSGVLIVRYTEFASLTFEVSKMLIVLVMSKPLYQR